MYTSFIFIQKVLILILLIELLLAKTVQPIQLQLSHGALLLLLHVIGCYDRFVVIRVTRLERVDSVCLRNISRDKH